MQNDISLFLYKEKTENSFLHLPCTDGKKLSIYGATMERVYLDKEASQQRILTFGFLFPLQNK